MGMKGKEFWVEGYITTGDLDLVNDIVTKNCMDSMMAQFDMRSIKLDFEHETFRGDTDLGAEAAKTKLPLGKAVKQNKDSKGVKVSWKLNPTWKKFDEKGNIVMTFSEVWQNVEEGYYDAYSIAYVPTKTTSIDKEGTTIRLLDNVNLLNVALTGNAINPNASMTSVMAKSLEFMKDKEEQTNTTDMTGIEIKNRVDKLTKDLTKIKEQMGCKPMVDKKDNPPEAPAQTPEGNEQPSQGAEPTPAEPGQEPTPTEGGEQPEGKSMIDIKARIEKLETEVKSVKKENEDLKAIVEKARQKSIGAENREQTDQGQTQPSMVGPLDVI